MQGVKRMRTRLNKINIRNTAVFLILLYVVLTRIVTPSYMAFAFRGPVSDLENEYTCN